jgi:hypothetical protein
MRMPYVLESIITPTASHPKEIPVYRQQVLHSSLCMIGSHIPAAAKRDVIALPWIKTILPSVLIEHCGMATGAVYAESINS